MKRAASALAILALIFVVPSVGGSKADADLRSQLKARSQARTQHAETMASVSETNIDVQTLIVLDADIRQLIRDDDATQYAWSKRIAKRDDDEALARRLQVITASFGALEFVLIVLILITRRRA